MKVANVKVILRTLDDNIHHFIDRFTKRASFTHQLNNQWFKELRSHIHQVTFTLNDSKNESFLTSRDARQSASFFEREKNDDLVKLNEFYRAVLKDFIDSFRCLEKDIYTYVAEVDASYTEALDMSKKQLNALESFRQFVRSLDKEEHYFAQELDELKYENELLKEDLATLDNEKEEVRIRSKGDVISLVRQLDEQRYINQKLSDTICQMEREISALEEHIFTSKKQLEMVPKLEEKLDSLSFEESKLRSQIQYLSLENDKLHQSVEQCNADSQIRAREQKQTCSQLEAIEDELARVKQCNDQVKDAYRQADDSLNLKDSELISLREEVKLGRSNMMEVIQKTEHCVQELLQRCTSYTARIDSLEEINNRLVDQNSKLVCQLECLDDKYKAEKIRNKKYELKKAVSKQIRDTNNNIADY
jgi:chromosome segregation ATPase